MTKSTEKASGTRLKTLLARYGLTGNVAANEAARLLGYHPQSIQAMYTRGIRYNDYELLHYKLAEKYGKK